VVSFQFVFFFVFILFVVADFFSVFFFCQVKYSVKVLPVLKLWRKMNLNHTLRTKLMYHCSWIRDYYCLLAVNRESFWRTVGTESHEGLISHFLLKSFQCISPAIMMNIYGLYCGLSKEFQRMLLSCCYSAKCWRENRTVLRSEDFLAYSPSYFPEYQDNNNDSTFNSIYMNSS
jgi:hypothetical protein